MRQPEEAQVLERVGVYGFGGGSQKRRKYDVQEEDDTMEMVQIGAERTKNVLILMSDTGGGHRASAEAIRDAFKLEFGDEYRLWPGTKGSFHQHLERFQFKENS